MVAGYAGGGVMDDLKVMPNNPNFVGNQWDMIIKCIENGYAVEVSQDMMEDTVMIDLIDNKTGKAVMMCKGLCYHTHVPKKLRTGSFLGGLGPGLEVSE